MSVCKTRVGMIVDTPEVNMVTVIDKECGGDG